MIGYDWDYCSRNGIPGYDEWKTRSPDDEMDMHLGWNLDDDEPEPSEDEYLAQWAERDWWDLMIDMMEGQRTPGWAWREPIVSFYCPVTDVHFVSVVVTPPILF